MKAQRVYAKLLSNAGSAMKGAVFINFDYQFFSEHIKPMSSIVSVEVFPAGTYGNIRLVTANSTFPQMSEQVLTDVREGCYMGATYRFSAFSTMSKKNK